MPWQEYAADVERQFNPQANPHIDVRGEFELRAQLSAAARGRMQGRCDVRYGPAPRQLLDIFPAGDGTAPIHVHIHGGYWRMGDKYNQSLTAEAFVQAGIPTVLPTYDLCPQVTLDQLVAQVFDAIEWIHRNAAGIGGDGNRLFISGSSAGAHLCAMALAHDWAQRGLPADLIRGATLLTGVYDIEPTLHLSLNQLVRLEPGMVRRNSPMFNPPLRPVPILLEVGGEEPAGWQAQTIEYAKVCADAGCTTEVFVLPGETHFSITRSLADPRHPLTQKMLAQMQAVTA